MKKTFFEDVLQYGVKNPLINMMPIKEHGGTYQIPFINAKNKESILTVMASWSIQSGWDHVSVSKAHRCPTWQELEFIKDLFFDPKEVVMQLHVAKENHRNLHPYCLHLWRPHDQEIPLPPNCFVA